MNAAKVAVHPIHILRIRDSSSHNVEEYFSKYFLSQTGKGGD